MPKKSQDMSEIEAAAAVEDELEEVDTDAEDDEIETDSEKLAKLRTEIIVLTARRDAMAAAASAVPDESAKALLNAEVDKLTATITRRQTQLGRAEEEAQYGAYTAPFLAELESIKPSADAKYQDVSAKSLVEAVQLDKITIAGLRASVYMTLDLLDALDGAMESALADVPESVWDSLAGKKISFRRNEDGTYTGQFAGSRRATSSSDGTGSGRGNPGAYEIRILPENYSGPAQVGDRFGKGTENPVGKDFVEKVLGQEYITWKAGRAGRVSAASALRHFGFVIAKVDPSGQTSADDGEDSDDE